MSGYWFFTNATTGGTAQTAPAGAAIAGEQIRIRAISASCSSAGVLTITDSAGSPNTYLTVGIPAGGSFAQSDLDIRIAVGLNAVIGVTNGNGCNCQGDLVPQGSPYGLM